MSSAPAVSVPVEKEAQTLLLAMLTTLMEGNGSDFHLRTNKVPYLRIDGELTRDLSNQPVRIETMNEIIRLLLTMRGGGANSVRWEDFEGALRRDACVNFSASTEYFNVRDSVEFPKARMRVSCLIDDNGTSVVGRLLKDHIPSLTELGFDDQVAEKVRLMVRRARGMILVTGPTGSGKTTTMGSIINEINLSRCVHIITIEDPIELKYGQYSPIDPESDIFQSLITQREIGLHCNSFRHGLDESLRHDPNIILVGEIRTKETMEAALMAAETGHLVITTLHTNGGFQAISRIVSEFPADRKSFICEQLSRNLNCVVSQRLLRRADGEGRVLCYEYLEVKGPIKAALNQNDILGIPNSMDKENSIKWNDSIKGLLDAGIITQETFESNKTLEQD
jgi:twitching motility protein PilT